MKTAATVMLTTLTVLMAVACSKPRPPDKEKPPAPRAAVAVEASTNA